MESIDIKLKPTTPTRKRRISSLWHLPIFFALSFIWMETVFRVTIYKSFFGAGLIYSTLFSVVTALVFALLSTLSKNRKVNFAVATGLIAAIYLLFGIQMVYFTVFQVPMAAFSFTTVTLREYAVAVGLGALVIPIVEIVKLLQRKLAR